MYVHYIMYVAVAPRANKSYVQLQNSGNVSGSADQNYLTDMIGRLSFPTTIASWCGVFTPPMMDGDVCGLRHVCIVVLHSTNQHKSTVPL